ncbi:MAG: PaaI family thioesterase [Gemmatimonas sp.]|jgi:1,4-dihydroxy-2-naphthoyl-CoA hydrolase|uniref:PaaI family thioesterase n=1 Tax=Gemmatimonas sp. TaxID=1962908 RepID=UPI00391FAF7C|nr:PaaI family thioesterase [Gemmatimonadota bacterium]
MHLTLAQLQARAGTCLPAYLGIRITHAAPGVMHAEFDVRAEIMAVNGFLHAGAIVSLADTAAGFGCINNLPAGAESFTTIELKTNHVGTAREGTVSCSATLVHGGRTTQVWDAVVTHVRTGKAIAHYRCTQLILYPRG